MGQESDPLKRNLAFNHLIRLLIHLLLIKCYSRTSPSFSLGTRLLQEVLAAQGQTQPSDRPINTRQFSMPAVSSQPTVVSITPTKTSSRKSPLPVPRDNMKERPSPTSPNDTRISWHHKVPNPTISHSAIPIGNNFVQAERTRKVEPVALKEERVVMTTEGSI